MVEPLTTTSVTSYAWWILKRIILHDVQSLRILLFSLYKRQKEVRVATSAMLRIADGNKYLLVKNLHRPDIFGPFGGVYKCDVEAQALLDRVEFKPQDEPDPIDMKGDLRGFLPRRNLSAFRTWFLDGRDREEPITCLRRELKEELEQIGTSVDHQIIDTLRFRLVRRVDEGPAAAVGQPYQQYRMFEVYEIILTSDRVKHFVQELFLLPAGNDGLIVVSASEIIKGRAANGCQIGQHAAYLLGSKQIRPEPPSF